MSPSNTVAWFGGFVVGCCILLGACYLLAVGLWLGCRWYHDPLRRYTRSIRRAHRRDLAELRRMSSSPYVWGQRDRLR